MLGGLLASVVVVGSDPWIRWAGPLRGLVIGATVLAVAGAPTFESFDFRILEPAQLNVGMFLGLFALFGFAVAGSSRVLDRLMPEGRSGACRSMSRSWGLPLYLSC